jgi:hypothetical protein
MPKGRVVRVGWFTTEAYTNLLLRAKSCETALSECGNPKGLAGLASGFQKYLYLRRAHRTPGCPHRRRRKTAQLVVDLRN